MLHSAAWALAGATRSLEEALKLQKRFLEGMDDAPEGSGSSSPEQPEAETGPAPASQTNPTPTRPASRVIASARKTIRMRHEAEARGSDRL